MRTIFVLSTLTGALIAGLNGSDVSFAFSFAGMLAVAGLTRITWQEHFQYADFGVALDTSHRRDHKPAFPIIVVRFGAVGARLMDWSLAVVWPEAKQERSA